MTAMSLITNNVSFLLLTLLHALANASGFNCHTHQNNESDIYQCDNGDCILKSSKCDGKSDCSDGSDEGADECDDVRIALIAVGAGIGGVLVLIITGGIIVYVCCRKTQPSCISKVSNVISGGIETAVKGIAKCCQATSEHLQSCTSKVDHIICGGIEAVLKGLYYCLLCPFGIIMGFCFWVIGDCCKLLERCLQKTMQRCLEKTMQRATTREPNRQTCDRQIEGGHDPDIGDYDDDNACRGSIGGGSYGAGSFGGGSFGSYD